MLFGARSRPAFDFARALSLHPAVPRCSAPRAVAERSARVSTLELFFDVVFVFTITQLTGVLVDGEGLAALVQVVVMLLLIWWMYDGYAWLTNAIATDRLRFRLLLLWVTSRIIGRNHARLAAAAAALATIPLGTEVGAVAQVGAIATLVTAALAAEALLWLPQRLPDASRASEPPTTLTGI
jgi:low temperature requirement A protein (LtrA)